MATAVRSLLPPAERIVSIEHTLELRIHQPNTIRFEAREVGKSATTVRDLVKHSLRLRHDPIVVGEIRGAEAADLLQAFKTGHGGSLTTIHANNASSALDRLASWRHAGPRPNPPAALTNPEREPRGPSS